MFREVQAIAEEQISLDKNKEEIEVEIEVDEVEHSPDAISLLSKGS